jgi:outer membrane protein assembly factor BamB
MGTPEGVRAVDEESGTLLWQSTHRGFPVSVSGDTLYVRRLTEDYQFVCFDTLETAAGGFIRTVVQWRSLTNELIQDGLLLCATSEGEEAVCAVGLDDGEVRWRSKVGDDRGVWTTLSGDSRQVYVTLRDGPVIALDRESGRERWRHSLADLVWNAGPEPRTGQARDAPKIVGDRVILDAYGGWIVALSTDGGDRLWAHHCAGDISQSVIQGGAYHALVLPGDLVSLDPVSGSVLASVNLDRKVPRPAVPIRRVTMPLLVSATHVFAGSEEGYVLAFERPKGKYVWSHRPKGAATTAHDGNRFVAAGGRLYYSDMSLRLYGLEEEHSASAAPRKGGVVAQRRRS